MKDWIEILIGVVVFGVLIFVHVIDHIIAFKKMLDKRKADAEAAAMNPVDAEPLRDTPMRDVPARALPAPPPFASPVLPASGAPPKPPRDSRRRKPNPAEPQARVEMPVLAAPVVLRRSSPVLPLVQEMMRDRRNLAAAVVLQEIFGPPKSKRP